MESSPAARFEYKWVSPVSFSAEGLAKLMREVLEELGYSFIRDRVQKHYDRFYVIVPMFRFAYAFRYNVTKPAEFTVDMYDTQPTHSSVMPYLEIDPVNERNIEDIQRLLFLLVKKMPRKPWKFTMGQRLMHGAVMPEFRKAKKAWKKIGVLI